ncbi:MAG: hypothetical protein LBP43_02115 [Treponema sp.]|jgi:hypothetical protein|nr:hypothetical protein [Treponema sp.]
MRLCRFRFFLLFAAVFWLAGALRSPADELPPDPASLIGLTLEGMISRFGVPQSVYALRGPEEWQDDVVFVYDQGDFYVYKDRIWQLGVNAAYNIKVGDPRGTVFLVLGEEIQNFEDHIISPLPGRAWPLALRVNFDPSGLVSAIFVYRPDF